VSDSGFSVFREAGPDSVEEAEAFQGVVRAVQIVIWINSNKLKRLQLCHRLSRH
jgi:hypothetical protein